MMERRFTEEEVAVIFERAAESQQQGVTKQRATSDGMTLAQLKDIGREVGIDGAAVERAARSLDVVGRPMERTLLGLPIGVGRTIQLPRKLSEEEWERLVVDLRETFDARGKLRHEGNFRSWNNGNLQALLEPTPTGQQLRLRTLNGQARSLMAGGAAVLIGGWAALALRAANTGIDAGIATRFGILLAIAAGMFAWGALRLPSWARTRRQQMEEVAGRLSSSLDDDPPR